MGSNEKGLTMPAWWNTNILYSMICNDEQGLDFSQSNRVDEKYSSHLFGKVEVTKDELKVFQKLFDASLRNKTTRDRRDGSAPGKLELVKGWRVQNEQNWKAYSRRQATIRADLAGRRQRGEQFMGAVAKLKTAGQLPHEERYVM